MPRVQVPNVGMVQFPDNMSEEQIIAAIQRDILPSVQQAQPTTDQTKPEDLGFGERIKAAGRKGIEGFGEMLGGLGLAKEAATGDTAAAKTRMEGIKARKKEEEAGPRETLTAEDIARIYKERGLLSAAGAVPSYIAEQLTASAPQMAGPLAVGAATSPFLTPVGGTIAGIATYGVQQFGNFLVRQAEQNKDPEELELTKAALTAAGTAPLGYFADRFAAGLGSASSKTVGKEVLSELAKRRAAGEVGIGAVGKEVGKRAAKGATMGIIAEAPTEVLEQAAERWQAGLSLTDEEAKREFTEAFFGAAAVGGGLGATSRGIQTYAGYRGELPAAAAALEPGKSVIERAGETDETIGTGAGPSQPSLPGLGGEGVADTGAGAAAPGSVGRPSEVADTTAAREETERRALEEQKLFDQQFNAWLQTKGMTETDITSNEDYEALVEMWRAEVAKGQTPPPVTTTAEVTPPAPPAAPPVDNTAQIVELQDKITQAQNYLRDPNLAEDQYDYAVAQIQQLQAQIDTLKAEQTAPTTGTAKPMSAPEQAGFEFEEPSGDVQRAIETGPTPEFALEAETGALPTGDVVPLDALGAQPRSRMGLIGEASQPLEPVTNFLNALKPASEVETQTKNYRAEVNKVLQLLREFMGQPTKMVAGRTPGTKVPDVSGQLDPQEAMLRAAYLDQFFDTLSAVPPGREEQTMSLPQRLVGMDAKDQARTFEQLLDIPNLNTYRGIQELRERVEDALVDYEQQKLGEKSALLPFKAGAREEMSPFVRRAILELADIPANQRDKYEKAAYLYFSRKVSGADPYNMAMRSAAYDLGVTIDPFFKGAIRKGENKETAAEFLYWIRNNLPQQEYRRFRATVREFKRMTDKAERFAEKSRQVIKGDVGRTYITSISRAPTGKTEGFKPDAGLGKYKPPSKGVSVMHPAIEEKIRQGDLRGALLELAGDKSMYIGRVAKRLAELPLNTSISIGNQEAMFDSYIKTEYGQTYDSLMNFLKFAYPEVGAVFEGKGVRDTFAALQMLKDGQFTGVDAMPLMGQIEVLLEAYGDAVSMMDKPGAYFPHLDAININPDMGGMSNYVFLHEVAHAASYWALDPNNYEKLNPAQKKAVSELYKLYESVRTNKDLNGEYGLTDIYEFVAEALSNRRFQVKLRQVKYEGETSYWDRFVRFISQLVGLGNVLGQTLINANQILMAPPPVTDHSKVMAASDKPGLSALDGTRRVGNSGMGLGQMISASFQGRPSWETMKSATPLWLESLKDSTRKYYLGAFTLRQLSDMIGNKLPMFKTFVDSVEQMLDDRNAILNKTSDIARMWQNFQDKNPKLANVLNKLMIDATVDGIDPSKGKTGVTSVDKAWNEIGPEGQKIYTEVKNFYKQRLQEYVQVILDRKAESLIGKGIPEAQVTSHPEYVKLKEHFAKDVVEPYFPLRRFGNYWLQIGKGKDKEFYQFESAFERNLFKKQRLAQLKGKVQEDQVRTGNQINQMLSSNIKDLSFLKELKELLDVTPGASKGTYKKNLEESIEQLYLMTLPDQSVRKMFLNRQGIQGMNADMLRAFTSSAFHMAYQHSRFKHSANLYGLVDSARGFLEGQETDEAKVNRDYIEELAQRVDYIMNPTDTGTIPSILSNVSFIWYMTAPASALVNMLGVPAIGMPVVSAKFGAGDTSKTMLKYAKMVGTSGFRDADGKVAFPSLMNKESKLTDVQKRAFEKFVNDGLLDITLQHDIVGMADAPSNLYTGRSQRVMKVLSGLFHGAEKFNREVVAMSAFELAYKRNIKNMSADRAFEKAIETAKELTYKSMFDYSTLNKPRYFQNATAKVILQFKQFSQQMTYMLARSAYEGFYRKFSPTELVDIGNEINRTRRLDGQQDLQGADLRAAVDQYIKDMRSEGKKRLFGTLGMTFVFAGATGLPGWWALSKIAEAVEYAFREEGEEDKPFDFDNWFKNWMAETFGGFAGDSISRGVATQVFGVNLADRMGLNDLWFRDTRKSTDEVTALQNFVFSLLGPSAGLAINAAEGLKQLNEGYIWRATETMTPAVIKNALKGIRLSDTFGEGRATTKKGDVLVDDLGIGEVLGQSIGFTPERVAQRQKANIEMKTAEQEILDKRQSLLNAYFMAIDNSDAEMLQKVSTKIARFNSSNPTFGITGSNLSRSIRERYRQRALAQITGGMNINKKLIGELGGMAAYGNPD